MRTWRKRKGSSRTPRRATFGTLSSHKPSSGCVAAAFHACAVSSVVVVHVGLPVAVRLLVARRLVLARLASAGHGADHGAYCRAVAGVARDRADREAAERAA